jgi:uncharacterized protein with FMN-binding domain
MRRIVLWVASTVSVLVLLFGYHTSTSGAGNPTAQVAVVSGATSDDSQGSSSTGSRAGSASSGTSGTKTAKRDQQTTRTVTGAVASTQWGPVQVQLKVKGGTITQVSVVQYPNGNPQDAEINARALPILMQETTTSQNAHIDMVSGATVTSTGYLQSLQSALDEAGL